MSAMQILAERLAFPEGPAFQASGALWFVEYESGHLSQWKAGEVTRVPCGGQPNGLAFDGQSRAWVCDAGRNAVIRYGLPAGARQVFAATINGSALFMPNDLAFDAQGNLLFSCPGGEANQATGYVCCLTPSGQLTTIAEQMYFPNGLAFSADGRTLYIAETYQQRIWRGEWDDTMQRWHNPQPWAYVGGTTDGPDGMAIGADGQLYVAVYSLGCIKAIAPDGATSAVYSLPGNNPTNCAFDPTGQLGLVVTEAEKGLLISLPELGPGVPLFDGGTAWPGD
jgi:gluconolactonase